jgi:hypothetical protein
MTAPRTIEATLESSALLVRVEVAMNADGRIVGLRALRADPSRQRLVDSIAREIAAGARIEDIRVRALAWTDLIAGLHRMEITAMKEHAP